ncbi:MAG: NAD-dependent deacylase [candidate division Zixibacteria bacterium]
MPIEFSERFLNALKTANSVVVSTGAGVSAESGVPTFRGEEGLWKKFRAEELATFDAFNANPELVWEWYQHRREIISKIKPNPGHHAIVKMAKLFDNFQLVSQNIDGLHRLAGSDDIVELHGSIKRNKCLECDELNYDEEFEQFPPLCKCGGRLRPDVVWFGEMLPRGALEKAFAVSRSCDLFFTVGTSGIVQPAASLPQTAKQHGAFVVEVNIESTELTFIVDQHLRGKSGDILPAVVTKIKELRG